jgi:hypothetical protein
MASSSSYQAMGARMLRRERAAPAIDNGGGRTSFVECRLAAAIETMAGATAPNRHFGMMRIYT